MDQNNSSLLELEEYPDLPLIQYDTILSDEPESMNISPDLPSIAYFVPLDVAAVKSLSPWSVSPCGLIPLPRFTALFREASAKPLPRPAPLSPIKAPLPPQNKLSSPLPPRPSPATNRPAPPPVAAQPSHSSAIQSEISVIKSPIFIPPPDSNSSPRVQNSEVNLLPAYFNTQPATELSDTMLQLPPFTESQYRAYNLNLMPMPAEPTEQDVYKDLMSYFNLTPFPWQEELLTKFLELQNIYSINSLVFSAPTGAGKSLIGDFFTLKNYLEEQTTLWITPYIALINEKINSFTAIEQISTIYAIHSNIPFPKKIAKQSVIIATPEKALSLLPKIKDLSLVVFDEIHLVGGDNGRGAVFEVLLVLLRHLFSCKIIGMSATMKNIGELAEFLGPNSSYYSSTFKSKNIKEYLIHNKDFYECGPQNLTHLSTLDMPLPAILHKFLKSSEQTIVFCPSKIDTQKFAVLFKNLIKDQDSALLEQEVQKLSDPEKFLPMLKNGVCYHNSDLLLRDREVLENMFKKKLIRVIFATPTLSAGVNLPVDSVIISSTRIGMTSLNNTVYQQMRGRCGRFKDGQVVLIAAEKSSLEDAKSIVYNESSLFISSQSGFSHEFIELLVLNAIDIRGSVSLDDLVLLCQKSLFATQFNIRSRNHLETTKRVSDVIDKLINQKILKLKNSEYSLDRNGHAIITLHLPLDCVRAIIQLLDITLKDMNLSEETFFLALCVDPESRWMGLKGHELVQLASTVSTSRAELIRTLKKSQFHERLYSHALLFKEAINEVDISVLSANYKLIPGVIQSLAMSAASHSRKMAVLANRLNYNNMVENIFLTLAERLSFCSSTDITPLLRLHGVGPSKARLLVSMGIDQPKELINVDSRVLASKTSWTISFCENLILQAKRIEEFPEQANYAPFQ